MRRLLLVLLSVPLTSCLGLPSRQTPLIRAADSLPESTPWDLAALSQPPEFEWGQEQEIRSLYFQGEPYRGQPTRVFAYYATPGSLSGDASMDSELPAVVLVHGGGGKAFSKWVRLWASRGYAAIAMDLTGAGPERKKLPDAGPAMSDPVIFNSMAEPVTDQWTYHAVANVIRAHSLILSLPEVDPRRTAITGISWGGYLTCIVAGLDNRFSAAAPVYGCGFLHENSVWRNRLNQLPQEERAQWVQLWDPSQYVGSASMPMFFVNGGKDFAYPPDSHAKTYALVRSQKNLYFVPELTHGHRFGQPKELERFIGQYLNDGVPLPKIGRPKRGAEKITAQVESTTPLVEATLHYTRDPSSIRANQREWLTIPAAVTGKTISVGLPPDDTRIWFLTVKDELGSVVSSGLSFPNAP